MRGGCNWVGVVWRGRGKKTRYSSYTPPKYPTVLGPNLPDVWIPSTKSQRPQSSASFRKPSNWHYKYLCFLFNIFLFLFCFNCLCFFFWKSTECLFTTCKPANGQAAAVIDGKSIAQDIKFRIAGEIRRTKAAIGKCPGLAVVLVGERRDSRTYINIKLRACEEVGIATQIAKLPENCTETELLDVVSDFNEDPSVHGIIVQLPLPQVIFTAAPDF